MRSLQRRLVLTLSWMLLAAGALASIGLYWLAVRQQGQVLDERLRALSFNLPAEAVLRVPREESGGVATDGIVVQIWRRNGVLLWSSADRAVPVASEIGMTNLEYGGERWRSFTRVVRPSGLVLQVSQDLEARERLAAAAALQLLIPLIVLLPVLALLSGWIVANQLRPLRQLAVQMRRRAAQDTAPVLLDDMPTELAPVLTSLNDLLARQAEAARRQRDFLADAAHELRTPLAAVRLQAQRAERTEDAATRAEALGALTLGVDRATHLVAQLLSLARSDALRDDATLTPVALDTLVRDVLAQRFPIAEARGLDLGADDLAPATVDGNREALASLIGNLLDNALAYTPAPGRVDVSLQVDGEHARLIVDDSGPGIAPEQRTRVFERFERGGGADRAGTGLGLAIARRVAERHGGRIALQDRPDGHGLRACVELPLARRGASP